MATTTKLTAACALYLNHKTISVTGAQSGRRALRAFPRRKVAFSPPVLQSSNSAATESEAEISKDKEPNPNLAEPTRLEALSDGAFAIVTLH